jgi:hypothetical protein
MKGLTMLITGSHSLDVEQLASILKGLSVDVTVRGG